MNNDKAQDFFSAYREGTLDSGLRQQFEQKLVQDAGLSSAFAAFNRTMDKLDALKLEEVAIPSDLNDRVRARVDLAVHQQKRGAPSPIFLLWRNLALAGVAAALVIVSLTSLGRHGQANGPSTSAVGSFTGTGEQVTFKQLADVRGVQMEFTPSTEKTLIVRDGIDGRELKRDILDGRNIVARPLVNDQPLAALMSVVVEGDARETLVALPGTRATKQSSGQGQIKDLAVALASYYRQPVIVDVSDPTASATWSFATVDQSQAAKTALDGQKYTVSTLSSGLLKIMDR